MIVISEQTFREQSAIVSVTDICYCDIHFFFVKVEGLGGAFDSAKNHKRQRRKRQSVTAKREKSQTPKFV